MTVEELYTLLESASGAAEVLAALDEAVREFGDRIGWAPVGRPNNRGTIEAAEDPGRSLVERVTNAIDAILEGEHDSHGGVPDCRSPREAAQAWLNVPESGLARLTAAERRTLSQRVTVRILPGDSREARIVEIRDRGIGIRPDQMSETILSLNESNKIQKHYLAGAYGQGGSSTFAASWYTLIASRHPSHPNVGFTVVRFMDLPPEEFKIGHYVYMTLDGAVLEAPVDLSQAPVGTSVRHFGYDLSHYSSPLGPSSVYGLLNQVLFDPILPVWLDNRVHDYRRVIKGARNALNGAIDDQEDGRGPNLSHRMPMFYVSLGEQGRIGLEYWVLEKPTRAHRRPTAAFVNPAKPIVLTLNGQNQEELSLTLVRRDAELPYLAQRLICHVDCNSLTAAALRSLFVSNREGARRGMLLERIKEELVRVLRSDDDLTRLNAEARAEAQHERDEEAVLEARRTVARLLRLQGLTVSADIGGSVAVGGGRDERPVRPPRPRPTPPPIELHDPPTYVRIVWDEDRELTFYPEQRRYLRIETDAPSHYHSPSNPANSRINLIVSNGEVAFRGSTPLQGGRLRAIVDCPAGARVGGDGVIRVELSRPGLPVLADERRFRVETAPPARPANRAIALPPFDYRPVGQDDDMWAELDWPEEPDEVASSAVMEEGQLVVYYSTAFPKFAAQRARFEHRDPTLALSFETRYAIWLVVHSLLVHGSGGEGPAGTSLTPEQEEVGEAQERRERVRMATIAALVAAREIESGVQDTGEESE